MTEVGLTTYRRPFSLSASLSASETRRFSYFRNAGSHVVRATIQHVGTQLNVKNSSISNNLIQQKYSV